jgi:hypothetical protein
MKTKGFARLVVALTCVGLSSAPFAHAENIRAHSLDIALSQGGMLSGQVVNAEGQPLAGEAVVVKSGGKEIARCQSGKDGSFRIANLKGGSVEVAAVRVAGNCRLWAPGTAPPAAQTGLLVVAEGDVVRGQHMGRNVPGRSNRGGVRGHGGGLLGLMIDHPLVTAGAVGAAIAIPLAVSNDESPSSP